MPESATFDRILSLVESGKYVASRHALKEAADDDILISDLISGIARGELIEDYPDYHAGPCCLILQTDNRARPVHALWGLAKVGGQSAVLVTCYRPDQRRWDADFRRRKK